MYTNQRKEELLNDKFHLYLDQDQGLQEIQMVNFNNLKNKAPAYTKLEDQGDNSNLFLPRNNKTSPSNDQTRIFADKPLTPVTSFNFQPNQILINGMTFIHKDAIKGMAKTSTKSKKPQMEVQCQYCCSLQMVPANTHSFICYNCDCTQGCNPQFGIFICGSCQRQVWYPLGESSLIKCMKCGTVNNIPFSDGHQSQQNKQYFQNMKEQRSPEILESGDGQVNEKYFTQKHPM